MNPRSALAEFRERQRHLQLVVSTLAPAVVLLEVASREPSIANLDCRFGARGRRRAAYLVRLRERLIVSEGALACEEYSYSIQGGDGSEVLSYHLHPAIGTVDAHHLHLSAGSGDLIPDLAKSHLPTGAVAASQIVRLLIRDFNVRTLRDDWKQILA